MTLDDLNNLNIKDIPNWPVLPKVVAMLILFASILFAGYWFVWSTQLSELDAEQQKEVKLRETFLSKKKQAINLETYKQQLKDIEQSFGALLKQLPNKSEMEALLTDINQAGLGRGLQIDLFKPASSETQTEFYAELPITIRLTGGYHDLGAFASDVSLLSRIVTLNNISITAGKDNLVMDVVAKTFRYLDEEEISAQKKASKKDEKGQKK
jgi:type IV pilus assembly protein PilO